jgi:hypothetical protein
MTWYDVPWTEDERSRRWFRYMAWFYLLAFAIHTADHLRRGTGVLTAEVLVLGTVVGVMQLVAIWAVFGRRSWAPLAAVSIGFPDAVGIFTVHLLPHWSSFSDSFAGAHGTEVTTFSWFAASLEIAAALAFGLAGAYALWRAFELRAPGLPSRGAGGPAEVPK